VKINGFKGLMVKGFIACIIIASFLAISLPAMAEPVTPTTPIVKILAPGENWDIPAGITKLTTLVIGEGATITPPSGYSVTMTINGIETGQKLIPATSTNTFGVDTYFVPATYEGQIVLTAAVTNPQTFQITCPLRQALYLDSTGIVNDKSVLSAVTGQTPTNSNISNLWIRSTGEDFNGIYAAGGAYSIKNANIHFIGNGRDDFVGYGAAAAASGTGTTLVLDKADIETQGAVRTGVFASDGSNVIVKNSCIEVNNGVLPDNYLGTVDQAQMMSAPWMLSISGNNRATNLMGDYTTASYINSYLFAEGWGVLSTDTGSVGRTLNAVDSMIATGKDGYGSYAIGNVAENFLGCMFNVGTYATINRGGDCYYGDSTPAAVAALNASSAIGLTPTELAKLPVRPTIINSKRFGLMWHGSGSATIDGGTVINSKEATFLDKGQAITLNVDGSKNARFNPGNGVLFQLMDDDDPGPQPPNMWNTGVYTQPTGAVAADPDHDVYTTGSGDALVNFSNISLSGNFYNGTRGGVVQGAFGPPSSISKNLVLTFDNSKIIGIITASDAVHNVSPIDSTNYLQLGEVHNVLGPVVNNGVIVSLTNGSKWKIMGTSYLSSLSIDDTSAITTRAGKTVTMTVDDIPTPIAPGTYTGLITLTVN